jgi:diguanylate cyclase (GGDEF)-like protein
MANVESPLPGAEAVVVGRARSHLTVGGHLRRVGMRVIDTPDIPGAVRVMVARRPALAVVQTTSGPATGAVVVLAQAMREAGHQADILAVGAPDTATVVAALKAGATEAFPASIPDEELGVRLRRILDRHAARLNLLSRLDYLEWLSRTDLLTSFPNRRGMAEVLFRNASVAARHGLSLAVVMFDVDWFKDINDRIGHGGGDAALREVAIRLRARVREGDMIGRWGGDEFLAVLPYTTLAEAENMAERARASIAATPLVFERSRISMTVSAGCTATPGSGEELLARCDLALYESKAAGKNQVRTRSG